MIPTEPTRFFVGMHALVTGGAGFVGSHLVDRLLAEGAVVTVYDSEITGRQRFLEKAATSPNYRYVAGDLTAAESLGAALEGQDVVFHLAANADIRHGAEQPTRDFQQNVLATQVLLNNMRQNKVRRIVFASSGAVYGSTSGVSVIEQCRFPVQNSLYGASKLAAEGLISAFCHTFEMSAVIYRFTPMLGERYSHGHIFDFVKKLVARPERLEVLGTGGEQKRGLYIGDAIDAVLLGMRRGSGKVSVFNVGGIEPYSIAEAVELVSTMVGKPSQIVYTGKTWAGDNPDMDLNCGLIASLGWQPTVRPWVAIARTVSYLLENRWLLDRES